MSGRRRFDSEFRDGTVRIVLESGKPVAAVARDLGVNEGALGNWVVMSSAAGVRPHWHLTSVKCRKGIHDRPCATQRVRKRVTTSPTRLRLSACSELVTKVMTIVGVGPGLGEALARRFGSSGYAVGEIGRDQAMLDSLRGGLRSTG